jgi:hypothetical protein
MFVALLVSMLMTAVFVSFQEGNGADESHTTREGKEQPKTIVLVGSHDPEVLRRACAKPAD